MAIQNDDWDIRKSWLYTQVGGNGDYYINVAEEKRVPGGNPDEMVIQNHSIRITTSGSRYPPEVMLAVANLHRTLEEFGLNERTFNKEIEFHRNKTRNDAK